MSKLYIDAQSRNIIYLILFFVILTPFKANAQFTITENFKGSSVGGNIVLGGEPTAYLTSGIDDPVNNGWLRLTNDNTQQKGYAYINTSFPSTLGVYIDFEYKTWRSKKDDTYHGADGISVFLFDANVNFQPGGFGGSLGYANNSATNNGMPGAYLGIGIDEYGNFATTGDQKNGGVGGLQPNSIALRGTAANKWNYLTHKKLDASASANGVNSVDYNTVTSTRPNDNTFYRRVKIYIEPIGTPASPKYKIRLLWRTSVNGADIELITYETTDPIPQNLKMGFGASTGGGYNFHEIRNVLITTPGGFRVNKSVDKDNAVVGDELTYKIDVYNETTAAVQNLLFEDNITLANGSNISSDDFEITGITFNNNGNSGNTAAGFVSGVTKTSGLSNPFSTTLNMAASSSAYFTVTGNVKRVPVGGVIKNLTEIDPSNTGIYDNDPTNNYSTVTTSVLNTDVDLKIEKGVDNNGLAKLDGNRFTIIVSNMSSINKPNNQLVTVTDIIPQELTVTGITASGWTVTNTGNNYTFTRKDALESMYSYPAILIDVKSPTGGSWTNTATVVYEFDTDPSNNESSASLRWVNYWHGTVDNDWNKTGNWTAGYIPASGENVEFATETNNPTVTGANSSGPAKRDLHLDTDRIIGDLTNNSDKDLIVTTGNQLKINGRVIDNNGSAGTIIVKSKSIGANAIEPSGTLLFATPFQNRNVNATVEFYNQAYDCVDCGFYTRSWQYFGIPVNSSVFPYNDVSGSEDVNQWVESFNGNKWQPAPFAPDTKLQAFRGYQITNNIETQPNDVYNFKGILNVGDETIDITRTNNVNYQGVNLIGNSYTAAIPINSTTLSFPEGADKTVYLFNTGTRDQWRKLNGAAINQQGFRSGQYLAVPLNLGGQENLPDRIPSMHSFMVVVGSGTGGGVVIDYSELVKNTTVNRGDGSQIVTRAAINSTNSSIQQLPSILIDVIGEASADRLWLFAKEGTTYGFDNGWDSKKMLENDIAQIYAEDNSGDDRFQVATIPTFNNLTLGLNADTKGEYKLEFKLSDHFVNKEIYLHDITSGKKILISDGATYSFNSDAGNFSSRFRLLSSSVDDKTDVILVSVVDHKIIINNITPNSCTVFVSGTDGKLLNQINVAPDSKNIIQMDTPGSYIVRIQNADLHQINKVIIE